jgi:hypothetical protein
MPVARRTKPARRRREPRRDPNYATLPSQAGTAIERGEVQQWAARLGPGWEVIHRTNFGNRFGLARAFRGQGRPDMVAVNHRRRAVLVGDVTTRPRADHIDKTQGYARRYLAQIPTVAPTLNGYRVFAQERYWGRPPGSRAMPSRPTSPRWRIRPGAFPELEAESAWRRALRGQAGRFPARRLASHLRAQGFIPTAHFLQRFVERLQAQGMRYEPRRFGHDFDAARHARQTRPGRSTNLAWVWDVPIVYRRGGRAGNRIVLVSLLPSGATPPHRVITAPAREAAAPTQPLCQTPVEQARQECIAAGLRWEMYRRQPSGSRRPWADFLTRDEYGRFLATFTFTRERAPGRYRDAIAARDAFLAIRPELPLHYRLKDAASSAGLTQTSSGLALVAERRSLTSVLSNAATQAILDHVGENVSRFIFGANVWGALGIVSQYADLARSLEDERLLTMKGRAGEDARFRRKLSLVLRAVAADRGGPSPSRRADIQIAMWNRYWEIERIIARYSESLDLERSLDPLLRLAPRQPATIGRAP